MRDKETIKCEHCNDTGYEWVEGTGLDSYEEGWERPCMYCDKYEEDNKKDER